MRVPATASSSPLIRLAATQLAAQCGFDLDRIEDVRIAVHESVRILIGAPEHERSGPVRTAPTLETIFTVGPAALTVDIGLVGDRDSDGVDGDTVPILEATTSSFHLDTTGPAPRAVTVQFDRHRTKGATG